MGDDAAITLHATIKATTNQVSSELAGESIILSLRTARYYGLEQVGARIWELVRQPVRVMELRDVILDEFQVEPGRCEADLLALLHQLAGEGLIEVCDAHSAS
jgi:hypothetical protein